METKTYRAATMLLALQEVQKELGPDAIVISMREVPANMLRKAFCEIVATRGVKKAAPLQAAPAKTPAPAAQKAYSAQNSAPARDEAAPPPAASAPKATVPFSPRVISSRSNATPWLIPELGGTQENSPKEPARPAAAPQPASAEPKAAMEELVAHTPLDQVRLKLRTQGLDESLIDRLVQACMNTLSVTRLANENFLNDYVRKQLLAGLKPSIQNLAVGRHVVCLVGAGGAGKTSVAAKLAAYFVLQLGKRVAWIEANTVRTGAIGEARSITESFGVDLYLAYTPEDVREAVEKTAEMDLVLVDTPGCNPRKEAGLVELGGLLTNAAGRLTYLVAPATTKEADLVQAMSAFGPFGLDGLIATKLDEATTVGSIYNLAWSSKLPVIFYSAGTSAMDGLKGSSSPIMVEMLLAEGA